MRRSVTALAGGLPVALLAHAATFGGGHSAGGALHGLLLDSALALIALGVGLALLQAKSLSYASAGSVVATRLAKAAPSLVSLVATATGWLFAIESIEPSHVAAPLALFVAVVLSALVARQTVRVCLRAIAAVVVGFGATRGIARQFALVPVRFAAAPLHIGRLDRVRRFSRPPPLLP